ncbi:MAG: hypothetical protein N2508_05080, partial [Anaerolineae bacterium]|nr:hypothetical protein [Anaerolineae bacterium]
TCIRDSLSTGQGSVAPHPAGPPLPFLHQDVGQPGWQRLLTLPLVGEVGWLLPFALLGIPLLLAQPGWRRPLSDQHLAVVLWSGWLVPALGYFTFTRGLFHAHYLVMLGAPLAALVGMTAWALERMYRGHRRLGSLLSVLLTGSTVGFQVITLRSHPGYSKWILPLVRDLVRHQHQAMAAFLLHAWWVAVIPVVMLAVGLGIPALTARPGRYRFNRAVFGISIMAILVAPLFWSAVTTFNPHPDLCLPRSGFHLHHTNCPATLPAAEQRTLEHLLANAAPGSYLVATLAGHEAALYVLATGRPVLPLGGFTGSDEVVDVTRLAQMVREGRLRFILDSPELAWRKPELGAWLNAHCRKQTHRLYDCGSLE